MNDPKKSMIQNAVEASALVGGAVRQKKRRRVKDGIHEHLSYLEIKTTYGMGRGVFTLKDFAAREVIEECPCLIISNAQSMAGALADYCFGYQEGYSAIALGHGMLYNHSYDPNVSWRWVAEDHIQFWALKDIPSGSELFYNYTKKWWEQRGREPIKK